MVDILFPLPGLPTGFIRSAGWPRELVNKVKRILAGVASRSFSIIKYMSEESLITIKQAAKKLSVHTETLRRWDRLGKLKAVRLGNRGDRRYRLSDIEKLME